MSNLTYTEPKARRLRRLAQQEEFTTDDGKPDTVRLANAVGVSRDAARFILFGELPKKTRKPRQPREPQGDDDAESSE